MFMAAKDVINLKGEFYQYKLPHKVYEQPEVILPKKFSKLKTPEQLLATLFYSYVKKDKNLFLSLFDEKSVKIVKALPEDKYNQQMDVMKLITKPAINYAFKYNGGIVISWKDPLFKQARQIFIKKNKDTYKISSFKADKNDHYFWNVNQYMAGAPFKIYSPELLKTIKKIKNGQKKTLTFKLHRDGNYIHLIKKNSKKINLSLRDNYEQKNAPLQDSNFKIKYVDVILQGENFNESGKNTLYYLESTYPMTTVSIEDLKKAKELIIQKE